MTIKDIKGKTATSETFSKDWPTWMIQAMGINQIANEDYNTARRFDLNGRKVFPNTKGIQIVKDQTKSIKKIINK